VVAAAVVAVIFAVVIPARGYAADSTARGYAAESTARGYAAESPRATESDVAGAPVPFGSAVNYGDAPSQLNAPIVDMAPTPNGDGYWLVASDGGIFSFGDAAFHGSMGGKKLNAPIVGMAPTPNGDGYWLVAADGGIFSFGDAAFHGSMGGKRLNDPVVGMAATSNGDGYWLVASDGGLFSFGNAAFHGSMGGKKLNDPVVGMAATSNGDGYWLVASDGGLFSFGDAGFHGSMAGSPLDNPVIAMAATPGNQGYWLLPGSPPPPPPGPPPPPPGCAPGFVCGHVTAIGDSVMLDVQPDLQADIPGIDVEAAVSRQWDDGIALAQQLKASGTLGSIVVIDLGTNGPVDLAQFQQMMSALAGASLVVFVTVHLPPSYSWWQSVNETLEQGVPMYPNTRLANFNALADANPQWFGSDGVHMPVGGAGAQAMASLIASEI
jgi:hypothetical protein